VGLEGVQHCALRDLPFDLELHLALDPRQLAQVGRKHVIFCTEGFGIVTHDCQAEETARMCKK
jgi:hypothetical protein